jgi:hypothetical protein
VATVIFPRLVLYKPLVEGVVEEMVKAVALLVAVVVVEIYMGAQALHQIKHPMTLLWFLETVAAPARAITVHRVAAAAPDLLAWPECQI